MTISSLPRSAARFLGCGLLFVLVATLAAVGCSKAPAGKEAKPVEVTVTTPIADDVIEYQDFTGRLDAYRTVDIRARVTGILTSEIMFREGDYVKKDQPLYLIDPRPYKAAYDQAVTQIALNEATLSLARATLERDAAAPSGVSPQQVDQDRAAVAEALARLNSAKANVEAAKINLDFTRITAPFDGRISRRVIDPGNDVIADNTLLTTLVTETPVYVYFDVDERTFLDLQKLQGEWLNPLLQLKVGLRVPNANQLPVDAAVAVLSQSRVLMRLANEEKFTRIGAINFVDNRVIATTGTIRMRGVFQNPNGDLTSGLFARVRLPTGKPYNALLIPDEALLSDQGRKYVYVVNAENKVEYRDVELGQVVEGQRVVKKESSSGDASAAPSTTEQVSLRVIKKGLKAGDQVIVIGMQRVKPEQNVTVKMQEPVKPVNSPMKQLSPEFGTKTK